jgi:hypothetical protein
MTANAQAARVVAEAVAVVAVVAVEAAEEAAFQTAAAVAGQTGRVRRKSVRVKMMTTPLVTQAVPRAGRG